MLIIHKQSVTTQMFALQTFACVFEWLSMFEPAARILEKN